MSTPPTRRSILLIIGGGIAAYKALEVLRLLKQAGYGVRCVMTHAAQQFVTPLSVAALSEEPVFHDLFSLKDETEMGHIQLSRQADLLVFCPATAHLIGQMAHGLVPDLATTVCLATDKPVLMAPAMNVRMWHHPATQRNVAQLLQDGVRMVGPVEGPMACGEYGMGRMCEPAEIVAAIDAVFHQGPLAGRHVIVTAGPTHEPIDPVRVIANRSSGKQGYALASALAALGARVTLVSGPVALPTPVGVERMDVMTAQDMYAAVHAALPADVLIAAAAVADWRVDCAAQKIKKNQGQVPSLAWHENPDILADVAALQKKRPRLVVGFAAETQDILKNAQAKRLRKGCDWIIANDVSAQSPVLGGDTTTVHVITQDSVEHWASMSKRDVADKLARKIADVFLI